MVPLKLLPSLMWVPMGKRKTLIHLSIILIVYNVQFVYSACPTDAIKMAQTFRTQCLQQGGSHQSVE